METIVFSCPKCGFQMSAETIYCGQMVRCAQCSQEFLIPQKTEQSTDVQKSPSEEKKSNFNQKLTSTSFLLWLLIALQFLCFVLLICINSSTKSSPDSYEYQVQSYGRYYKRSFEEKMQKLGKDGWEYVGPLSNGEVLFRRSKGVFNSTEKK